ncbi:alpha-N-acetylglucosaminidase TIM-barrel domain-containing protein [Streptomyces sp. NPDC050256]|uniref:alpha-N-acetylglucosaminidase n=1 Tax=Streptomyces sp. NPDC050256 TaxID=3365607 RepID=UPI0037A4C046
MTTASDGPGTGAARHAIDRLAAPFSYGVTLTLSAHDPEGFTIGTDENRAVRVTGSTTVALVSGFHWYLTHCAHGHLSRTGDVIPAGPARPPVEPVSRTTPYGDRYMYNFTVGGYTTPYWTFDAWERELDLIAAHGINRALVTTGLETLWLHTFTRFGYGEEEVRRWISAPSVQPWQWMGNTSGLGPTPSAGLIEQRAELGQRIVRRMRELGIEPVLPGYQGLVPPDFAERVTGARTVAQGKWGPFDQPDWMAPDSAAFQQVAAAYYDVQKELFGTARYQAIDLFMEGGETGGTDLAAATRAIEASLHKAFGPDHRWVIQAWGPNPPAALLDAADRERLLVLDLSTERDERWQTREAFQGAPWALGTLCDVGGRPGLYGAVADLLTRIPATLTAPGRGRLTGLAVMLEGLQNHGPVFSALSDLVWESEPQDPAEWIESYATSRYGRRDGDAVAAWQLLQRSAYSSWHDWPSGADSLYAARPSLEADKASPFGPDALTYNPELLHEALTRLLRAASRLNGCATYAYDLVDLARQVAVNRARALLPRLRAAHENGDADSFSRLTRGFLDAGALASEVAATHSAFLLEPWLAQAESWGATDEERATLRADAARLVTVWGDRPAPAWVEDYANRDWSALLTHYYLPRWRRYLAARGEELRTSESAPEFDWYAEGAAWAADPPRTAAAPTGDPIAAARAVAAAVMCW